MLFAPPEAAAWLDALRASTLAEATAQKRQAEEQWRKPLTERLANGRAIGNLKILRQEKHKILFE